MGNIISRLAGLIMSDAGIVCDAPPTLHDPRIILGGTAAPELCMLPTDPRFPAGEELAHIAALRGSRVCQLKADGLNTMYLDAQVIGGREGAPLACGLHCQPGLARLEEAFGHPMVFFGEYVAEEGFSATLAEHKRGTGEGVFWVHDAMPHGAWVTGRDYEVPVEVRLGDLRRQFERANTGLFVGLLDHWVLDGRQMAAKAAELWAAGYEGMVGKAAGSGITRRRDFRWMKMKQRFKVPCPVVDTLHRNGTLRSIIVRGPEPSNPKPLTITGGWSDSEAESIDIGMADGSEGRIVAVEFGLTTDSLKRSVRGAKFAGLVA